MAPPWRFEYIGVVEAVAATLRWWRLSGDGVVALPDAVSPPSRSV
jgi:hypothetical protein